MIVCIVVCARRCGEAVVLTEARWCGRGSLAPPAAGDGLGLAPAVVRLRRHQGSVSTNVHVDIFRQTG